MQIPRTLYADTARPAPPTPPLDGDRRVSVVVIGAGFTGLSAALHLAEGGVDCPPALLDAWPVAPHHGADEILHGVALELRAFEAALVVTDHAVTVRPCAAGIAQKFGRHFLQQGEFLGRNGN